MTIHFANTNFACGWYADPCCDSLENAFLDLGTPEVPAVPAVPGTPFIPGTPGTPDIPATPGTPFIPGTPATPDTPANPGQPFIPADPGQPFIPPTPGGPTCVGAALAPASGGSVTDMDGVYPAGPLTTPAVPGNPRIDVQGPADQACSFQFTLDASNAFAVPSSDWSVAAQDSASANIDLTGATTAAAFGVAPNTAVIGPVSATLPDGTKITIVSGTVRIDGATGSPFTILPGDAGLPVTIKYDFPLGTKALRIIPGNLTGDTHSSISDLQTAVPVIGPADPGQPFIPATPGQPFIPATPFIPGTPATPDIPATPGTPFIPGTPGTPDIPATPGTPEIPAVPAIPGKADLAQRCLDTAAEILYALSGRQFGLCELKVRPCRTDCCDPCSNEMSGYRWTPALIGGQWTNVTCGGCKDACSCTKVCDVVLPGPIDSIVEVKLNGEVLPPSAYRVDNRNALVALKRPMPITGDFLIVFAGLDPSARITTSAPATSLQHGIDYGGNVYGGDDQSPNTGLLYMVFRDVDCVTVAYEGPDGAGSAVSRPGTADNAPGDAWSWPVPPFNFVVGSPVVSSVHADGSSIKATLTTGTASVANPNPGPGARNIVFNNGSTIEFCPSQLEEFCWPTCQDMNLDADQDNTWEVTYMRGIAIPSGAVSALGELACEICKACLGDTSCCLPSRVTQLSRPGVTMALLDPMEFISIGKTGLYLVDLWLRSVNPNALSRGPAILSPDMPQVRRTTWPG